MTLNNPDLIKNMYDGFIEDQQRKEHTSQTMDLDAAFDEAYEESKQ